MIDFDVKLNSELLLKKGRATAYYDEDTETIFFGKGTWIWLYLQSNNLDKFDDFFINMIRVLNHETIHHALNTIIGKEVSIMYDNVYYHLQYPKSYRQFV